MLRQLGLVMLGLVVVLLAAGQLARAATVANGSDAGWSWDTRNLAFSASDGTALRDVIDGGRGRDRMLAGAGNDLIEARDGFRDMIDCGPGDDTAVVDRLDVVRGCERVLRP